MSPGSSRVARHEVPDAQFEYKDMIQQRLSGPGLTTPRHRLGELLALHAAGNPTLARGIVDATSSRSSMSTSTRMPTSRIPAERIVVR
jgi:hypothetical protein